MTQEQFEKSALANSTHIEGQIEADFTQMPDYKMIPFLRALKRDVLRWKSEQEAAGASNE